MSNEPILIKDKGKQSIVVTEEIIKNLLPWLVNNDSDLLLTDNVLTQESNFHEHNIIHMCFDSQNLLT